MSSNSLCVPCARFDSELPSIKFCMDCEETLCRDCVKAHKTIKMLMAHHLTDLEASREMPAVVMSSRKHCLSHSDFILDFYCTYHDFLCCQSCISTDHRGCDKVLPLKEASKTIKTSALFVDTTDDFKKILLTTEEVIKNRKCNIKKIEDDGASIVNSISKAKVSIIKKAEEMEKSALSKLSHLQVTVVSNLKSECDKAEQIGKLVHEQIQRMEFLSKNGSNNQMFVLLQELKGVLSFENQNITDFISKLQEQSLSFKETPIFASDLDIGSIDITSHPCSVRYKDTKLRLSFDIPVTKSPRFFRLHHEIRVLSFWEALLNGISGIVCIDQQKFAVCAYESNQLYIYDFDGNRLNSIQLEYRCNPCGLAYNSTTQTIVVNLTNYKLQFIENFKASPAVAIPHGAKYGVSWVNDKFYVGGCGKAYILNKNMQEIQSYKVGEGDFFFLHFTDDKLYLSDFHKYNVYCMKEDGTIIFNFTSRNLQGPDGITNDKKGYIYVVGRYSNNIHRLSSDGTSSEVVLKKEDGLNQPIAICFSNDYKKLLVSNNKGRTISVFDCVY
ncbi:uncharacterized protein LOC134727583 [Mytilus trossulus]|uniref:uncharacterized protein LOC134727583 n=1 Tax=Mytilus trossulus TaxID=6551 RepID=UPI0030053738